MTPADREWVEFYAVVDFVIDTSGNYAPCPGGGDLYTHHEPISPAARGNLLAWLWREGAAYRDPDVLRLPALTHADHEARHRWLYARGGQDTLAMIEVEP